MLVADQKDSTDIVAALIEAKADPNVQDRVHIKTRAHRAHTPYAMVHCEWY
jgi:hypothetical protein